ncbi:hypothetical protein Hanom_Chr15g01368381 [Helianthus anomalus]
MLSESNDIDSDSDYVVSDELSDDGDDADFDAVVSGYEDGPDIYPIEFINEDDSSKSEWRPEKHGKGFRYVACQWTSKFTKPNGIYKNMKCKFVYSIDRAKLILKKVYK